MSTLTFKLNDGHSIPSIGFGTGTALYGKHAQDAVSVAVRNGVRHLDGAQMYQNEDSLGAAIAALTDPSSPDAVVPRAELFVTTKLWKVTAEKSVRDALVESLAKLRLEYVDLFLIHTPRDHPDLKAVWQGMEAVKEEGLARSIGVSNFRVQDFEQIMETAKIVPAVNQFEYHPYVHKASAPVLEYMAKYNIVAASYGGLTPIIRLKGGPVDPILKEVAARVSKDAGVAVSEAQVLQLWLRDKGIVVITTSRNGARAREYLATQSLPKLTEEEIKAIDEEGSKIHHKAFKVNGEDD